MQVKKNPKKDIRRWSLLFFQIGLILVLFISWRAIEKKTYEKEEEEDVVEVKYTDLDPEDVVVTEKPKTNTPPPPKPKTPEVLKIVDDEEDIEEDEPETIEDIEEEKVEVADIEEIDSAPGDDEGEEEEEIDEIPFDAVSDVPVFPGCEKHTDNAARKKCMSEQVQKFVMKRFNTDLGNKLGLSGMQRIYAQFVVDENGDIVEVRARNNNPQLAEEAERVVKMLPKMQPGKQSDKTVRVNYTLPISFKVQ